jgi:hypothetical protein
VLVAVLKTDSIEYMLPEEPAGWALAVLWQIGESLRANDDETPDPREFRLEGAEG